DTCRESGDRSHENDPQGDGAADGAALPNVYEEVEVEEVPFTEAARDAFARDAFALDEREGPVMHRDLGHIEVTGIDGITINRTKSGISPFVPIIKTPTYAENSGNHTGFAVEIEDP